MTTAWSPKVPKRDTRSGGGRTLLRCPDCGGNSITHELRGVLSGPDENRAWCTCGWDGIVEQAKCRTTLNERALAAPYPKPWRERPLVFHRPMVPTSSVEEPFSMRNGHLYFGIDSFDHPTVCLTPQDLDELKKFLEDHPAIDG